MSSVISIINYFSTTSSPELKFSFNKWLYNGFFSFCLRNFEIIPIYKKGSENNLPNISNKFDFCLSKYHLFSMKPFSFTGANLEKGLVSKLLSYQVRKMEIS